MGHIMARPVEPGVSGGAVANSPPKRTERIRGPFSRCSAVNRPISATKSKALTSPLVRQKIVSPVSRCPAVKNALGNKPISRPTLISISSIETELAEVRSAWARYRSTNSRDAVYIYLKVVFAVVTRWRRLNCAVKNSRAALRLQRDAPQMKLEPFGIVIFCTSDPEIADAKTRSKWSRALRFARKAKPIGQRLTDFIKSKGGLNECARKFARNK
jgi:hypothetical protein